VRLSVSDTGCGMDKATLARIFEPFFTTKQAGKGTGLGLATIHGIVAQSGGQITVDSEPGRGTTFHIYLPKTNELPATRFVQSAPGECPGGSETILLVDNEDVLRVLVRRILVARGYHVLEARCGDEALKIAAEHAGPIDLLLSDFAMRGLRGMELRDALRSRGGAMKVLLMSGFFENGIEAADSRSPACAVIQKPFTSDQLALHIRRMLDDEAEFTSPADPVPK
jgi:CheY-like chemotaxis protein